MDAQRKSTRLYYLFPPGIQNAALTYWGRRQSRIRFSGTFYERQEFLRDSQTWDEDRIRDYRDALLAGTVARAYHDTAYYRRIMDERGLKPDDIRGVADLQKLPITSKPDVRKHFDELVSSKISRRKLEVASTSGSTGTPLQTLWTRDGLAFKWAVWWRHRERFGMSRGALHAKFTAKPLVAARQRKAPHWRWNRHEHQAIVPMQQIRPERIAAIVDFLEATPFEFYSGATSIVHSAALAAADIGKRLARGPAVIFPGSENVHGFQRTSIERFTGAKISQLYGLAEGAGNASHCPEGNYHEDFEFGHLEPVDGVIDPETGAIRGRIVGTGFANPAFPLIRYDTGDIGVWRSADYRCPCGRESDVLSSIDGRAQDYLLTPEGQRISMLDNIFKHVDGLREAQIVQKQLDRVILRLVVGSEFSAEGEETLRKRVGSWLSESMSVAFEYPEAIERDTGGKFNAVVNSLGATQP